MVLVVCDIAVGPERPLTFLVGALSPVLEGLLVTLVVSGVLMGALLKPSTAIGGVVSPASIGIVVVWTVRRLRDQQGAQEPALEHHDGGRAAGPAPPPRAAPASSRTRSPAARPRR